MKRALCLLIVLSLLSGLHQGAAQNFVLTSSPPVGRIPLCVVAADINGDHKVDLISANLDDNTLTVLTNNGDGKFSFSATLNVGNCPNSVVAADVNHDGKLALICVNGCDNTLTVLTNNGAGVFTSNATYNVGNGAEALIAADVNGDGWVDLVCANFDDNTLTVLTNDEQGVFVVSSTNAVGRFPDFVAAADVNGDGHIDLIAANWGAKTVTVLTNNGFGAFGSNATYNVGSFPVSLAVADINGDGKPDLICANNDDDTLTVLTNDGSGLFMQASSISTGVASMAFGPQSVIATNLNGGSKTDLVFVDDSDFAVPGILTVLRNDGTGVFSISPVPRVGEGPEYVIAADVNGDGKLDLITANHLDDTLSVLISVPMLAINSSSNGLNVSWPSSWTNWTLQQNADLTTTNWSTSGAPVDDGTNKNVAITSPAGNLCFRLVHP